MQGVAATPMNAPSNTVPAATGAHHRGPNLRILATIFTILFNAGLYFVVSFSASKPHFPGPWESGQTITSFFQESSSGVLMCAFFHFGAGFLSNFHRYRS